MLQLSVKYEKIDKSQNQRPCCVLKKLLLRKFPKFLIKQTSVAESFVQMLLNNS